MAITNTNLNTTAHAETIVAVYDLQSFYNNRQAYVKNLKNKPILLGKYEIRFLNRVLNVVTPNSNRVVAVTMPGDYNLEVLDRQNFAIEGHLDLPGSAVELGQVFASLLDGKLPEALESKPLKPVNAEGLMPKDLLEYSPNCDWESSIAMFLADPRSFTEAVKMRLLTPGGDNFNFLTKWNPEKSRIEVSVSNPVTTVHLCNVEVGSFLQGSNDFLTHMNCYNEEVIKQVTDAIIRARAIASILNYGPVPGQFMNQQYPGAGSSAQWIPGHSVQHPQPFMSTNPAIDQYYTQQAHHAPLQPASGAWVPNQYMTGSVPFAPWRTDSAPDEQLTPNRHAPFSEFNAGIADSHDLNTVPTQAEVVDFEALYETLDRTKEVGQDLLAKDQSVDDIFSNKGL